MVVTQRTCSPFFTTGGRRLFITAIIWNVVTIVRFCVQAVPESVVRQALTMDEHAAAREDQRLVSPFGLIMTIIQQACD